MAQSSIASTSKSTHNINSNSPFNAFKFVHNFKYNYDLVCGFSTNINEYEKITNITPRNFEFKDDYKSYQTRNPYTAEISSINYLQ